MNKFFIAALTVSLILLSLLGMQAVEVGKANSKTITVPDDYPTIQAAIDNASAGDTVFVKNGIYHPTGFEIEIDKPISLVGEDSQKTVIQAFRAPSITHWVALAVLTDNVLITGFTLNASEIGISVDNYPIEPSNVRIIGNNIINNARWGVLLQSGTKNCVVSKNNITGNGEYGISAYSTDAVISENHIEGNGGGIDVRDTRNVTVTQNYIANNGEGGVALGWTGQYYVYQTTLQTIKGTAFNST